MLNSVSTTTVVQHQISRLSRLPLPQLNSTVRRSSRLDRFRGLVIVLDGISININVPLSRIAIRDSLVERLCNFCSIIRDLVGMSSFRSEFEFVA